MEKKMPRKYPTIACCGLDCGLCPSFHSGGTSRCMGCGCKEFYNKHPSCSILTCCLEKNIDCCSFCKDFPCKKISNWDQGDSFISHKVCLLNLREILKNGMENFIIQQEKRIDLLQIMLKKYNDGRSKSFFCLATALLPLDEIGNVIKKIEQSTNEGLENKTIILRKQLEDTANKIGIELKLRK